MQLERTLSLAPDSCAVVALGEATGVIRMPDGVWEIVGAGPAEVFEGGRAVGLDALAGKRIA